MEEVSFWGFLSDMRNGFMFPDFDLEEPYIISL